MIKIRLKPSYKISAYSVTLFIQALLLLCLLQTTLETWAKVHLIPDSRSIVRSLYCWIKPKINKIVQNTRGQALCKRLIGSKHLIIMLSGVLKHFDSLRKLDTGKKAETMKLSHLRLDYVIRSNTLAEANQRRPQELFVKVYASLLERYTPFLADSNTIIKLCGLPNQMRLWEFVTNTIRTRFKNHTNTFLV